MVRLTNWWRAVVSTLKEIFDRVEDREILERKVDDIIGFLEHLIDSKNGRDFEQVKLSRRQLHRALVEVLSGKTI